MGTRIIQRPGNSETLPRQVSRRFRSGAPPYVSRPPRADRPPARRLIIYWIHQAVRLPCPHHRATQSVARRKSNRHEDHGQTHHPNHRETTRSCDLQQQVQDGGGRRKPPLAFTEHEALMATTVLKTPTAVTTSDWALQPMQDPQGRSNDHETHRTYTRCNGVVRHHRPC